MSSPSLNDLIDAVDDYNQVIGAVRKRDIFIQNANFRTVHVLVFNQFGELLLQRLHHNHPRSPNLLGSSVAGYLHPNEIYQVAAKRRLKEELDIDSKLNYIKTLEMPDQGSKKFIGVYSTHSDSPTLREAAHAQSIRYHSVRSISQMITNDPYVFADTFRFIFSNLTVRDLENIQTHTLS